MMGWMAVATAAHPRRYPDVCTTAEAVEKIQRP